MWFMSEKREGWHLRVTVRRCGETPSAGIRRSEETGERAWPGCRGQGGEGVKGSLQAE